MPVLTASVIDQAGALAPAQVSALEAKLAGYERSLGTQIVVLIVPSTQPEDIADFTQRVGDAWRIGRREVGDGLLIVVAKDDRRVRIAPAKTLEGAIPDLAARQIIDRVVVPAFRAGDYAGGLNAAIDQLAARIRGEALPLPGKRSARTSDGADWQDLAVFFFIAVPIAGAVLTGVLGRKLGSLATAGGAGTLAWFATTSAVIAGVAGVVALLMVGVMGIGAARRGVSRRGGFDGPPIIWGGGGGGSGSSWGSSGGGGGFSSGGGGDFGGGGASGDW